MSKFVKLKDLCVKITDGSHYSPVGNSEGKYPMLSVKDMEENYFNYSNCKCITEEDYIKLLKNDVLIAKDGSYLKYIHVVEEEKEQAILSSIGILRPDLKKVTPYFLKYYLQMNSMKEQVAKKYVSGSALPRIILKSFGEIEILDVCIQTQGKITKILRKIDKKITLNNKIIQELETLAKTTYDYWFSQFEFPNEDGKPYKSSDGEMIWNEELKRDIPKGWRIGTLDSNIDIIIDHRGKTPKKLGGDWVEDGIMALSAKIVKNGRLINLDQANKVSEEMYEKWMPVKLQDGDILMTSEAPLGEFYYVLVKTEYCLSQRLYAIRANKSKVLSCYLYYELSKGNGYSQIMGSQSGSTVFGIRQDELRKIKILIPSMDIQKKFENIINPMLISIKKIDIQTQELIQLRDWLLPMLMNGQVTFKTEEYATEDTFFTERVAESVAEYKES